MEGAYDQARQLRGFRPDRNANCETDPRERMGLITATHTVAPSAAGETLEPRPGIRLRDRGFSKPCPRDVDPYCRPREAVPRFGL